jgi:peptidyl-prolyl cis-trans isomerase SurA
MERKLMTLNLFSLAKRLCSAAALCLAVGMPSQAQEDGFAPAVLVNGRVISQYEVRQRVLFMTLLRQPGDIPALAVSTLIDDTLRRDAAKKMEVAVTPDEIKAGMTEFAGRAKLPIEEFLKALAKGGVEPETLRDFVEAGLLWRAVVRAKFGATTDVSEAEIDRAIGSGVASGGELRVLLSEILLPTGGSTDAMALAQRLKLTATTLPTFSMAAQNYSKAPTARAGGALGWIPISALPPSLAPRILALEVGEVTDPIAVPGAVQLFYLRDLSLGAGDAKGASEVQYAQFFAPAGTDIAAVIASLDTCDDLYDAAKGLPADAVQRMTALEAGVGGGVGAALAALDPGEATVLAGATPSILMLCKRQPQSDIPASRDDVKTNLLNTRLGLLAGAYLEELRSNAIIKIQ